MIELYDHFARGRFFFLYPRNLGVGTVIDMVVNAYYLAAERVFGIGDAVAGCGVNDDTERGCIVGIIHGCILVTEEGYVIRIVGVEQEDLFFGKAQAQNFAQALGGANGVPVGTLVTKDDDVFVFFDCFLQLL